MMTVATLQRTSITLAVVGFLALGASATAVATPTVTLKTTALPIPGFPGTGNILGAGAVIRVQGTISGTEYGGFPPPLTEVRFYGPATAKLRPQGFAACAASVIEQSGPEACPKKSTAGPKGSASAVVSFGSERVLPWRRNRSSVVQDALPQEGSLVMIQSWPNEQVVSAAQRGDPRAITSLVSGSHAHVQRFSRTLCSTPEDAEDAAQEALVVLYRRIGTLRATAALGSWMFQIVRNECIRRSRVALRRPTATATAEPSAEDAALARLELERIVDLVAALPPEQRAVLVLGDIRGLSGTATAQALDLSRAAMKSRLHRARQTLRSQLRAPHDTTGHGGAGDA
jgi:RNA polymerase sigma factor (sigma-70 family)